MVWLRLRRSVESKLKGVTEARPLRPAGPDALSPGPPGLRVARPQVRGTVGSAEPVSGVKRSLPPACWVSPPRAALGPEPGDRDRLRLTWAALAAALTTGPAPATGSPCPAHLAPAPYSPARTALAASPGAGCRRLCRSPAGPRGAGNSAPLPPLLLPLLLLPPPLHPRRVQLQLLLPPSASSRLSAQRLRRRPRPPPRRAALAKVRVRAPPGPVSHRPSGPAALPEPSPWHRAARPPACLPAAGLRALERGAPTWEPRGPETPPRRPPRAPCMRALYLWLEGRAVRADDPAAHDARPWSRSPAPDRATAESWPPKAAGPGWPRSRRRARTLAGTQTHSPDTLAPARLRRRVGTAVGFE